MMHFPQNLKVGDTIGIIATARKISIEELEPTLALLAQWGLIVEFAPNLFEIENQFGGNDSQRAADLQWAINHTTIKAVLVARGGYGTSRIIDGVSFEKLIQFPKWFIGFSDFTVLLSQLFNQNMAAVHGPIAMLLGKEGHEQNAQSIRQILFAGMHDALIGKPSDLNKKGKAVGQLIGGNLTILHTLVATKSDIDYANKLLFFEDLDEYLYHIDRMMVHLDRADKLKNLAGLVVGHLSDMNDNAIPFGSNAQEIVARVAGKYNFPIAFGMPIGHEPSNSPLIVGAEYVLEVNEEGSVLALNRQLA